MGARQKLNSATVFGCLLIAGLVGLVTESPFVAAVTAAVLIAGAWNDGSIRPHGRENVMTPVCAIGTDNLLAIERRPPGRAGALF